MRHKDIMENFIEQNLAIEAYERNINKLGLVKLNEAFNRLIDTYRKVYPVEINIIHTDKYKIEVTLND